MTHTMCNLYTRTVLAACFLATLCGTNPVVKSGTNDLWQQTFRGSDLNQKELCYLVCSQSMWCPPTCPEHTLAMSRFKKGKSPNEPVLGNVSFEDYMFLRLLGRI